MSSYYEILNIESDASQNDIKKAYRKLAIKHHPDKGGDPEKFKQIAEAYEILSNTDKKQQYDNFGSVNMNANFNPMNIFQEFERMFRDDMFGPNRVGAPPFGGFSFPNQTDPLPNIFMDMGPMNMGSMNMGSMNMGSMNMGSMNMGPMNNGCFTQTVIIKDGKKTTTKTSNGKTTILEELMKDPYMHFNLQ